MTAFDSKLVKFLLWAIAVFSVGSFAMIGFLVSIRFEDSEKVHGVQTEQMMQKKDQNDLRIDNVYIKSELIEQGKRIDKLEATIDQKKISLQPSIHDEKD